MASWTDLLQDAVSALTSGDVVHATRLFNDLEQAAGSGGGAEAKSLSSAWEPFVCLLGRRGYFVGHPEETRNSLDEILGMGPGFDLYDLAASLARCDAALAVHVGAPSARLFHELTPFLAGSEGDTSPSIA